VVFRMRADAKVLKIRLAAAGLHEYPLDISPQLDEMYGRIILQDRIQTFDVWNHQTVDESAQEVMTHLAAMKWI
jgi:hypothetical protein